MQQNSTRKANVAKCQQKTYYCQTYQPSNQTPQKDHKMTGSTSTFGASMRVQINFQVASNPSINFCSKTNAQLFFKKKYEE
jgi:hypothetical protein